MYFQFKEVHIKYFSFNIIDIITIFRENAAIYGSYPPVVRGGALCFEAAIGFQQLCGGISLHSPLGPGAHSDNAKHVVRAFICLMKWEL